MIYPDFQNRSAQHLSELIKQEIEAHRAEVNGIKSIKPEEATFANTVLALEQSGKTLDLHTSVFFNLLHCDADDDFMRLSEELTPLLSDLNNEINMDIRLAKNIEQVYNNEYHVLTGIDKRLLQRTYEGYRDRGAFLEEDKREELKALRKELSLTTLKFGQNVLREQNEYTLQVLDKALISRLPQAALEVAQSKAKEKGVEEGYLFDFSFPSYMAIMKYCDDRATREKMYRDRQALCFDMNKETANVDIVFKIVELRSKIASLLGYTTYADYVLKERMAKTKENVYKMLDDLYDAYIGLAREEVRAVQDFAKTAKYAPLETGDIMPWDWSYYAEQYKVETLDYDEEETRPYFALDKVMEAMLSLAADLYDITFVPNYTLTKYHKDVEIYDVKAKDGSEIGILMTDFFPRKGKQSGAWMTNYVEAYDNVRPVVSLVMNFTPPTNSTPSLLTFDEATTLFHEFGHGLHGLLTTVKYASLSGTNVVRDFVELPSQIMENWMRSPEFVKGFAVHYQTGQSISEELLSAIERNALFLEGYACIRQLSFGYLDMAWHTGEADRLGTRDIEAFERLVGERTSLLPRVEGGCISCSFSHVFNGGYAVGYYGYKWAEILDADAFEEFHKNGLRDKETAFRFKENILQQGDAVDADVLYRRFKGKDATVAALKKRSGLKD
ncbi:M3 family metallopeptidase [Porphyromonas sp.]|uniref:M3 family metallopeptidase n=1 Tax=Porphyromonas sp. TaxID=1924944 RepID=UPI0026DB2C2B|nr:M3 family metallopeptidase [Porphyromonas sp.]MDO4695391.1 M3 family metallopeptidase [Porphyromonas sp.]MDO4770482.1 M3 family metallopeptidase [Porphyromonas sp.]